MLLSESQRAALHLATAGGFGPQAWATLWRDGGPLAILAVDEEEARAKLRTRKQLDAWKEARRAFHAKDDVRLAAAARLVERGARLMVRGDPGYPAALVGLEGAPPVLFVSGNRLEEALRQPCVAVVGTRRPSSYGAFMTEKIAGALARRGITIVSGAAEGIDTIAHHAALRAGGLTVAVLGTPLGVKDGSTELRQQIILQGGVLTEMVPGQDQHAGAFPQRNRMISGLSQVVLVMEGSDGSGTRITADCALKQGRPVLALPGDVTRPESATPNALLKLGARALTCAEDVLLELGLAVESSVPTRHQDPADPAEDPQEALEAPPLPEPLAHLLAALEGPRELPLDDVASRARMSAADASRGLLELELLGFIRRGHGGLFARTR